MTYEIALGDRTYLSWSLRGWLLFKRFGISYKAQHARLASDEFTTPMQDFWPARTVPAVRFPDVTIADSLDGVRRSEPLSHRAQPLGSAVGYRAGTGAFGGAETGDGARRCQRRPDIGHADIL